MEDRKEREARHWNRIADVYDRFVEREYGEDYKRFRKIFFMHVKRGHKVLDVATGTGDIALVLAKRSKDVTGVDIADAMIREAKTKVSGNPEFLSDDAYELDYKRGTFHLVTCCNGLHVMKEPERALAEMRRVLKKGGKLVTITYCYGTASFAKRSRLFVHYLKLGRPGYWHSFMPKALRRLHSDAGLKVLKCEFCREDPPAVLTIARK
jgi:ubiquinone/menaquinone biosynthesis C-methylase UbiE